MLRPDLGCARDQAIALGAAAAAFEQRVHQPPPLGWVERREDPAEQRQVGGKSLFVERHQPGVDGAAQRRVVDQPLAGALEEALEEAGRLGDRRARREHPCQQVGGLLGGEQFDLIEQPRGGAGDSRVA